MLEESILPMLCSSAIVRGLLIIIGNARSEALFYYFRLILTSEKITLLMCLSISQQMDFGHGAY